eukprot:TRINITY_DN15101_c0_g1_i1.p1 TRINITY_DN15101_c0_g1~~TRINITY_DN15101_c0_g1_i1.p1  ORF type:complete len:635 (-),score=81.02 TRINITY_DN15101_c0_g1_i1:94-1998(-)
MGGQVCGCSVPTRQHGQPGDASAEEEEEEEVLKGMLDLRGDYVYCNRQRDRIIDICNIRMRDGTGNVTYTALADLNYSATWDGKVLKAKYSARSDLVLLDNGEFYHVSNRSNILREVSAHWNWMKENNMTTAPRRAEGRDSLFNGGDHALEANHYKRTSHDSPLYEALASGSLRLVRGQFVRDCWKRRRPWPMCQEIPESGFWPPEEACSLWFTYGPVFFLALSYAWLHPVLNDPNMWHLERLACILEEVQRCSMARFLWFWKLGLIAKSAPGPPKDVGLFIDYCSLPQQDPSRSIIRTPEEHRHFVAGLGVADIIYGHANTTVIRITSVPPSEQRKYALRGWPSSERCVSSAKPGYCHRVLDFDDTFRPDENNLRGIELLYKSKGQSPPQTPQQFSEELQHKRVELEQMSPKIELFSKPEDESFVLQKYKDVWSEISKSEALAYRHVGWGEAEALKLASVLPDFVRLKSLVLMGNLIGSEGLVAVLRGLPATLEELTVRGSGGEQAVNDVAVELSRLTRLRALDLSDQEWNDEGVCILATHMPKTVRHLELIHVGMKELGLASIAGRFRQLHKLHITWNLLNEKAANVLIDALPGSTLESLGLALNPLSEDDKERIRNTWASMGRNMDWLEAG